VTLPPGPRLPPLAQTLDWVFRPTRFMSRCQQRYGDFFTVRLLGLGASGSVPAVFICDPVAVKAIFTADPALAPAGAGREAMEPMFGARSVLLIDGPEHMRQRKLMLPPFHGERLARYAELIGEIAGQEVSRWPRRSAFRLQERMQSITLEVILRVVFGLDEGERRDLVRARIKALLEIVANPLSELFAGLPERVGPVNLRAPFLKARDAADAVLYEEISSRRVEPGLEQRDDILSLLLQARDEKGETMTDRELRDQLVTLLLAGHETTATALAWALDQLLRRPDALQRSVVEARGDEAEHPYLEAVIKETLRMRPPIPIVDRRLAASFDFDGVRLPAGTIVAPCIYLIHHHPRVYPEPHAFRPERFLDAAPDGYAWLPFGGGVRRCLGASFALLEMRRVLQTVLARVELEPARARPEAIRRRAIVLAPRRGMPVRVKAEGRRLPAPRPPATTASARA